MQCYQTNQDLLDELDQCDWIEIGKGSQGSVYQYTSLKDERVYAMRLQQVLASAKNYDDQIQIIQSQQTILKQLTHSSILRIHAFYEIKNEKGYKHYTKMDYIDKSFQTIINKRIKLEPDLIRRFINQIFEVLSYINSQGFFHQNIKPSNIFIKEGRILLADFRSNNFNYNLKQVQLMKQNNAYFVKYFCPLINNKIEATIKNDNKQIEINMEKSDIWSVGITILHLINQEDKSLEDINDKYSGPEIVSKQIEKIRDQQFKEILSQMLALEENKRASINIILLQLKRYDQFIHKIDGGEYKGELKNGIRQGHGEFRWIRGKNKGHKYNGQWENDKRTGQGEFYFASGNKYIGLFKENKIHGQGEYIYKNGSRYIGQFNEGCMEGEGEYFYKDGSHYKGQWKQDMKHGQGVLSYYTGSQYKGEFKDNLMHGQGEFYWYNGDRYVGEFQEGYQQGKGIYYYNSGSRYEGIFNKDKLNGQGVYFNWADQSTYSGMFKDGVKHGDGELLKKDFTRYKQYYQKGILIIQKLIR